ncbi:MAG: hypothetical protein ABIH23_14570 [bacterium]
MSWPGLADTGASRTIVPLLACHELNLAPRDWRRPSGFDPQSPRRPIPLYYVRIGIAGIGDMPLHAYAVERSNILLGRDFLSDLVLLIDGRSSTWQLGRSSVVTRSLARLLALC